MNGRSINPDKLTLLQSLKPFLGPRGFQFIEAVEAFVEMLNTEGATKAHYAFTNILKGPKQVPAFADEGETKALSVQPVEDNSKAILDEIKRIIAKHDDVG